MLLSLSHFISSACVRSRVCVFMRACVLMSNGVVWCRRSLFLMNDLSGPSMVSYPKIPEKCKHLRFSEHLLATVTLISPFLAHATGRLLPQH